MVVYLLLSVKPHDHQCRKPLQDKLSRAAFLRPILGFSIIARQESLTAHGKWGHIPIGSDSAEVTVLIGGMNLSSGARNLSQRVEQYSNLQLINGRITELYVLYQEDNFDTNFDELIANMVDNSIRV